MRTASNVTDFFIPSEEQLLRVKENADNKGLSMPFERLWQMHAAKRESSIRARSLSDSPGMIIIENNNLIIPNIAKDNICITNKEVMNLGGKPVTVHTHNSLFIKE